MKYVMMHGRMGESWICVRRGRSRERNGNGMDVRSKRRRRSGMDTVVFHLHWR